LMPGATAEERRVEAVAAGTPVFRLSRNIG
jgi:hypothetical protein